MSDAALTPTPHDAFFKDAFSDPNTAAALLRPRLSQELSRRIDWSTLTLVPGSFVKHSLLQLHSDLLFMARAGKRNVLLYVLLEHQSTVDRLMALRLLGYMYEIWQDHVAQNPDDPLPLPHLIPFVVHQGPEGWEISVHFEDLFDRSDDFAGFLPYVPHFRHELLDLSKINPRSDEQDATLRIILELMKRIRERNQLVEFFAWLAQQLVGKPLPVDLLRTILTYAWNTDTRLDAEEIARTVEANPELQTTVMTYLEEIIAKGKAEGKAEGRAEGKAEGAWIGKIQLLEQIMELPVSASEALFGLDAAELQRRFQALERTYNTRFKVQD